MKEQESKQRNMLANQGAQMSPGEQIQHTPADAHPQELHNAKMWYDCLKTEALAIPVLPRRPSEGAPQR